MRDAVIEAAALRLRPILMTTGAMVLGAVPLALATGAGAESRQDIGWVIVGGLLVGTLFTLFVIPVVYTYLSRRVFIEADDELTPDTRRTGAAGAERSAQARRVADGKKEEPRRGECQARTHYTERTTDPDRTHLGNCSMPLTYGSFLTVPCQSLQYHKDLRARLHTRNGSAQPPLTNAAESQEFRRAEVDLVRRAAHAQ